MTYQQVYYLYLFSKDAISIYADKPLKFHQYDSFTEGSYAVIFVTEDILPHFFSVLCREKAF